MRIVFIILLAGLFVGCGYSESRTNVVVTPKTQAASLPIATVSASPTPNFIETKKGPALDKPKVENAHDYGPPYVTIQMPNKPATIAMENLENFKSLLNSGLKEEDYPEQRNQIYIVKNGTKVKYKDLSDDGIFAKMFIVNGPYKGRYAWFLRVVLQAPRD